MRQNVSKYMLKAIRMAEKSVEEGGGPFGAVIVKDNKMVAQASNSVIPMSDPTALAEIMAIRKACKKLKTHDLTGAIMYTSCEPSALALVAIYTAGIRQVCYGASRLDASGVGFDDSVIYSELSLEPQYRKVRTEQILRELALSPFRMWRDKEDKVTY